MYQTIVRTDLEIQQDVMNELGWDSRFHQAGIGVAVQKGVVTLTGNVDSFGKKLAAGELAHRVTGALDVANEIRVGATSSKTDVEIAKAVRHALEWDVFVPDEKIRSTISNGWVTLEGEVSFIRQREDAASAVRNLAGVVGVTNSIHVAARQVQPSEVRKRIEEALERRADREADQIAVMVVDGTVTLKGNVRSWAEKEAVLGTVSHAPGIRWVCDDLRVQPFA